MISHCVAGFGRPRILKLTCTQWYIIDWNKNDGNRTTSFTGKQRWEAELNNCKTLSSSFLYITRWQPTSTTHKPHSTNDSTERPADAVQTVLEGCWVAHHVGQSASANRSALSEWPGTHLKVVISSDTMLRRYVTAWFIVVWLLQSSQVVCCPVITLR